MFHALVPRPHCPPPHHCPEAQLPSPQALPGPSRPLIDRSPAAPLEGGAQVATEEGLTALQRREAWSKGLRGAARPSQRLQVGSAAPGGGPGQWRDRNAVADLLPAAPGEVGTFQGPAHCPGARPGQGQGATANSAPRATTLRDTPGPLHLPLSGQAGPHPGPAGPSSRTIKELEVHRRVLVAVGRRGPPPACCPPLGFDPCQKRGAPCVIPTDRRTLGRCPCPCPCRRPPPCRGGAPVLCKAPPLQLTGRHTQPGQEGAEPSPWDCRSRHPPSRAHPDTHAIGAGGV